MKSPTAEGGFPCLLLLAPAALAPLPLPPSGFLLAGRGSTRLVREFV